MARLQANKVPALFDSIKIALRDARVLAPLKMRDAPLAVPLDSDEHEYRDQQNRHHLRAPVSTIQALPFRGSGT